MRATRRGRVFDRARAAHDLAANQTVGLLASYLYGFSRASTPSAPGDCRCPSAPDYAVDDSASYAYGTTASVSHGLTRRGTLSGTVDYQLHRFPRGAAESARSVVLRRAGAVRSRHEPQRVVTLGISISDWRLRVHGCVTVGKTTEHGFDIGVDYVRPLSATRRLTFAFGVGLSAADVPQHWLRWRVLDAAAVSAFGATSRLGYQFRRYWETRASYRAGLRVCARTASAGLYRRFFCGRGRPVHAAHGLLGRRRLFDPASPRRREAPLRSTPTLPMSGCARR